MLTHPGSREEGNVLMSVCFPFHCTRPSGSDSAPVIHAPHSEEDKADALLVFLWCIYRGFYFKVVPGTTLFKLSIYDLFKSLFMLPLGQHLGLTELSDR